VGKLNYHFEHLPVGFYRLAAAQAGFQRYVIDGIQITAGFSAEVNIQMTVGAQNETVTVSAESPVPDTTSTTVSMSTGARTVDDQTQQPRTMQEMFRSRPA
jgi:anti-sigma factor RsiW